MRASHFPLNTVKETPADAELASHKLMLRSGMLKKLGAGLYTWTPLGLRVMRKVEAAVREEMDKAGALEMLMPTVQPKELWEETGRWQKFGGQLLKIKDRKEQEFCFGPTAEEVVTDWARTELRSYKQLPLNVYQIQTKFRDEIRPRFGIMRAREFLMKDAYSFHIDQASLDAEYQNMYDTYARIFTRLGLKFRAVKADTGAIGGSASHEFQVLADSGEDAIVYSDGSDYSANMELAEALAPKGRQANPKENFAEVATPEKTTCADVAELLGLSLERTVKAIAVVGEKALEGTNLFALVIVRGDHEVNETKLKKIAGLENYRLATEEEIKNHLNCRPGYIGPVYLNPHLAFHGNQHMYTLASERPGAPVYPFMLIIDRTVAAMSDFVCGANKAGYHCKGVNFDRDIKPGYLVADVRSVIEGDLSPDGHGTLHIVRGIEVGHVFSLGDNYAKAMGASVLDQAGKQVTLLMGCYGIGVSRIVAAAIEQNHDERGIIWPMQLAPFQIALLPLNMAKSEKLKAAAERLYGDLQAAGYDVFMDDRDLRPGPMFADAELIGIPHRLVLSERGLDAGTIEYKGRTDADKQDIPAAGIMEFLRQRLAAA